MVAFLVTIVLSVISTAILSYISMAVMIGPWIESTVILIASLIFNVVGARIISQSSRNESIVLTTAGASIGGILATGCGFAFPTLYFLMPDLFQSWIEHPVFFVVTMAGLAFSAATFGLFLANSFEHRLLVTDKLAFPIGEISHKMISAQNNMRKSLELAAGFVTSFIYSIIQRIYAIPSPLTLLPEFHWHMLTLPALKLPTSELPMLYAIGFVTGHVIAIPLALGILAKIFITSPAHTYYFAHLHQMDFLFAFGSGMMVYGAFMSFMELPKVVKNIIKHARQSTAQVTPGPGPVIRALDWQTLIIALISAFFFFTYFKFNLSYQVYLIVLTAFFTYQLCVIGGEYGIAPVGRYATFVMVPAIFLFGLNPIHLTFVSTFVEICGGVAVDILFSRKMGALAHVSHKKILKYQWLGIVVSSLTVGIIFRILINHLGLGTHQLLAQRSQTRALMINMKSFDFFALLMGALFGAILKDFKCNPIMVLGGILMPLDWSLVLVIAGLSTYLFKNKEEQYPFWSGIFAANSLWIIIKNFF